MKKRVLIVMTCALMAACSLVGCKKTCDLCGEKGSCETMEILGEKVNICDDCMSGSW